jgi:hypothetical protein
MPTVAPTKTVPPTKTKPVGKFRHAAGMTLIILGGLLLTRMHWMWTFDRSYFGPIEWVRFIACVWLGGLLGIVGCWLATRSKFAGVLALLAALSVFVLPYFIEYFVPYEAPR